MEQKKQATPQESQRILFLMQGDDQRLSTSEYAKKFNQTLEYIREKPQALTDGQRARVSYLVRCPDELPQTCYSINLETLELIILKKYEAGYHSTGGRRTTDGEVRSLNVCIGVTEEEREAMTILSMFRW